MRLGFAGAGNMAGAMARGWAATDGGPEAMLFSDLDRERAAALAAEVGGETRGDLRQLADDADALVLAVKPAALDAVAAELGGEAPPLISVLAATPVAKLAAAFPGVPILRLMPNQPVEARRGILCYAPPHSMPDGLVDQLLEVLSPLGTLVPLEERRMEAAMAVMSCSPAYVALIADALARAGERQGLDAALAGKLVTETVAGTAELLRVRTPAAIRRAVAPPGGATEAGLEVLERAGVPGALEDAVEASLERFR